MLVIIHLIAFFLTCDLVIYRTKSSSPFFILPPFHLLFHPSFSALDVLHVIRHPDHFLLVHIHFYERELVDFVFLMVMCTVILP